MTGRQAGMQAATSEAPEGQASQQARPSVCSPALPLKATKAKRAPLADLRQALRKQAVATEAGGRNGSRQSQQKQAVATEAGIRSGSRQSQRKQTVPKGAGSPKGSSQ